MPDQDTTTVHLKDGTALHLKGKNLSPEMVQQKVSAFRASQGPGTPDPTKPDPTAVAKSPAMEPSFFGGAHGTAEQEKFVHEKAPAATKTMKELSYGTVGAVAGGGTMTAASKGLPLLLRMLASSSGAGAGLGAGEVAAGKKPGTALEDAAATTAIGMGTELGLGAVAKVVSKMHLPKVDPLAKINKLLGAGPKEVRPGKMPSSLDEFASNPARGALKAGLDEKALAKMNPMERNAAVMKAKDAAGKALDQMLEQATAAGKKVDALSPTQKVFESILDPDLGKLSETRFAKILSDNGITNPAELKQLTPTQARGIQKGLDEFANFSGDTDAESFPGIATQLRRGISEATRKSVKEIGPLDQHYGDLANAGRATQKALKKFATSAPKNKLKELVIKAAIGYGGYEAGKHLGIPLP